jgi:hypothetical protein
MTSTIIAFALGVVGVIIMELLDSNAQADLLSEDLDAARKENEEYDNREER